MGAKSYTSCMITQQIEFLGLDPAHMLSILNDPETNMPLWADSIFKACGDALKELHIILHNKDTQSVWNEATQCYDVTPKGAHIHLVLKLARPMTLNVIASMFKVPVQYVEPPKTKGRYAYSNMLSYLIHAKDDDKYPYNPHEVASAGGRSYMSYYEEYKDIWALGKAKKIHEQANMSVDDIRLKIFTGAIQSMAQIYLTDDYFKVYQFNSDAIDKAFEIMSAKHAFDTAELIRQGKLFKQCFYIHGKAGTGKTSLAKEICAEFQRRDGYKVCQTASTNMFDEYKGEEILFMDDVRGGGCNAEDWLKLLDPCNVSPASARYRNKIMAPRIIIITSTRPLYEFFYFTRGIGSARAEALDQFVRRIQAVIKVIDFDTYVFSRTKKLDMPVSTYITRGAYNTVYEDMSYVTEQGMQLPKEDIVEIVKSIVDENKPANGLTRDPLN